MFEFRLKFHWSLFLRVQINNNPALFQIMAWRRPGDKPLSEPMMVSSLTHICVTQPQWVNTLWPEQNGRYFVDDIYKFDFLTWKRLFSFWFNWIFFLRFQSTRNQHWFRKWLGTKRATNHYLNQRWPILLTNLKQYVFHKLNKILHFVIFVHNESIVCQWNYMWSIVRHLKEHEELRSSTIQEPLACPLLYQCQEFDVSTVNNPLLIDTFISTYKFWNKLGQVQLHALDYFQRFCWTTFLRSALWSSDVISRCHQRTLNKNRTPFSQENLFDCVLCEMTLFVSDSGYYLDNCVIECSKLRSNF